MKLNHPGNGAAEVRLVVIAEYAWRVTRLRPYDDQACARRRALISVRANQACPNDAAAERAVNEVWESCFNDTRPFDEVRVSLCFACCIV